MSEYQYYEFQAVDRPLTEKQMGELRQYSSRAEITPHRFVNVYNYGNFGGDPATLVHKYFDAFLYLANWGTRWLMLRVPKKLLAPKTAAGYKAGDCLSHTSRADHVVLSFCSEDEEGDGWAEGDGWLASMIPIRAALMSGDHRALYLGWLLAVQSDEVDEDTLEPKVPPGLGELDGSLAQLVDFLRIDTDLIAAAAEQSDTLLSASLSKQEIAAWIAGLSAKTKDTVLAKLIAGQDPHAVAELQRQALDARRGSTSSTRARRRSAAALRERAYNLAQGSDEKETTRRTRAKGDKERKAAAKRKKHLKSLVGSEDSLWDSIDHLIDARHPERYDEAVSRLQDLRDLAAMRGEMNAFAARMAGLATEHARKATLVDRFRTLKQAALN